MLGKTLIAFGVMATLGAGLGATTASATPANGAAILASAPNTSEVMTVGYYGDSYYPRYHRYYAPRYYAPRYYGGHGY
jgi:hypothetical protein